MVPFLRDWLRVGAKAGEEVDASDDDGDDVVVVDEDEDEVDDDDADEEDAVDSDDELDVPSAEEASSTKLSTRSICLLRRCSGDLNASFCAIIRFEVPARRPSEATCKGCSSMETRDSLSGGKVRAFASACSISSSSSGKLGRLAPDLWLFKCRSGGDEPGDLLSVEVE